MEGDIWIGWVKISNFRFVDYTTWSIRTADGKNKFDAFEIWCYRRMLGIPWTATRTHLDTAEDNNPRRLSRFVFARIVTCFGHFTRTITGKYTTLIINAHLLQYIEQKEKIYWVNIFLQLEIAFKYLNF